jgi:hypothetical protein
MIITIVLSEILNNTSFFFRYLTSRPTDLNDLIEGDSLNLAAILPVSVSFMLLKYSAYHLKQPNSSHILRNKNEMRSTSIPVSCTLPTVPVTVESRSSLLLGRCSHQLRRSCVCANISCSRAEHVFVLRSLFR